MAQVSTEHLKQFNSNVGHGANFHLRAGPRSVHQSLIASNAFERFWAIVRRLLLREWPPSVRLSAQSFVATSGWLWNRFGFGNHMHSRERIRGAGRAVGFHTPAQPSKRRRLPSVSPVKRRQVTFSESDFDGVERFIRFPRNPQAWFECQCCALCSNLRVCLLLFKSMNVFYASTDVKT